MISMFFLSKIVKNETVAHANFCTCVKSIIIILYLFFTKF
jgi:hypothetical protein